MNGPDLRTGSIGVSVMMASRFLYLNTRPHEEEIIKNPDNNLFSACYFLLAILMSFVEVLYAKDWL